MLSGTLPLPSRSEHSDLSVSLLRGHRLSSGRAEWLRKGHLCSPLPDPSHHDDRAVEARGKTRTGSRHPEVTRVPGPTYLRRKLLRNPNHLQLPRTILTPTPTPTFTCTPNSQPLTQSSIVSGGRPLLPESTDEECDDRTRVNESGYDRDGRVGRVDKRSSKVKETETGRGDGAVADDLP